MVVAPLSFKDEYGYYGLRVNPSPEQAFGTVRNKLGVPLPDRRWKWYAMSPYRAFLEGQDTQAQAADYDELKYREKNLEVPETATKVKPSEAAHDPAWDRIQRQHENMQERDAYDTAFDAMNAEHVGETMRTRAEQLRQGTMARHNNMHPVVRDPFVLCRRNLRTDAGGGPTHILNLIVNRPFSPDHLPLFPVGASTNLWLLQTHVIS